MNIEVLKKVVQVRAIAESESKPGMYYLVETDADGMFHCTCKGFQYNRSCKHAKAIMETLVDLD